MDLSSLIELLHNTHIHEYFPCTDPYIFPDLDNLDITCPSWKPILNNAQKKLLLLPEIEKKLKKFTHINLWLL